MRGDLGFPVRLRFTKQGKVRFVGHRDVARAFERAFRIAALPLAFTQGFSPRPKVSFGLALSVGHESDAEYLDVELAHDPGLGGLPALLSAGLPEGIDVTGAVALVERAPALQEAITAVEYRVDVIGPEGAPAPVSAVGAAVTTALASPTLETARTRKGREVTEDVRPVIRRLDVQGPGATPGSVALELECTTQPRSARPGEIVAAIGGGDLVEQRVVRTHQWIERGGARLGPLEADARSRAPVARAS